MPLPPDQAEFLALLVVDLPASLRRAAEALEALGTRANLAGDALEEFAMDLENYGEAGR